MRIYLRALEAEDYLFTSKWRNDSKVTEMLGGNFQYVSREREKQWVQNAILNDSTNIRLCIVVKETEKLIGIVNLTSIDWINRKGEFSIMIGDRKEWRKGYGREATIQMLSFGFNQRNLERIYLTVDVNNENAISLYEKIGFKQEGLLRRDNFKDGVFRNMYLYSILREEYREISSI